MKRFLSLLLSFQLLIAPLANISRAAGLSGSVTPQIGGGISIGFDGGISSTNASPLFAANAGSDAANCLTPATACQTVTHVVAVVGTTPNRQILLNKGDTFRESGITLGASGLTLASYGSGAAPQILGSTQVITSWTLVSGTEYSTPLAYTPRTAFWINGATTTKLRPGTSGSLASNQYAVATGNLHVNIGINPTGQRIEIAANNSNIGITAQNQSGTSINGVAVMFMPFSGMLFNNTPSTMVQNNVISWNGDDGIDITAAGANVTIQNNTIQGNGFQARNAGGGPGDGISAHNLATVSIFGNTIIDNDQTGIGNENQTTIVAAYNFLRNNNFNIFIYNSGISTVGTHDWHYNIIVVTAGDQLGVDVNGPGDATGLSTIITMNNNTLHGETSAPAPLASFAAGTSTLRNNIFDGVSFGISNFNGLGGNVATQDVDFNLYSNVGNRYQPSFGPGTTGPNEATAVSAGFTNTTDNAENFQLLTTSAAKASGTNLGYTRDQVGAAVPFVPGAPCRGALERLAA